MNICTHVDRPALSECLSGAFFHLDLRDGPCAALVCAGLYRRHPDRLADRGCSREARGALAREHTADAARTGRGIADLGDPRDHSWRAAWLRAVLPTRLLFRQPDADPLHMARRHGVSRRADRGNSRWLALLHARLHPVALSGGHDGPGHTAGPAAGADRQLHQCRALGPADGAALGRAVSRCGGTVLGTSGGRDMCAASLATI